MSDTVVGKQKVVSITYSIVSDSGEVLEQSDIPVSYAHGGVNQMFPDVEAALEGRAVGDSIQVVLPPEKAFGEHDPSLTFVDDIDNVPPEFRHVGAEVEMRNDQGETRSFLVSKIEEGKLTVDGNHPFAGKTLTYAVTINDIRDATDEEMEKGASAPVLH
ncbi:FKBP-type peptidyl-prolyl cis-trans isomerase SlyD [hydrothermal vent metagenome]|uniref:peptidylprolyl isomerase n=1 Tax=hydrothermal vent metagenome TaxID=652676 RepID=A0A3B0YDR7_9ZZZZ